MDDMEEKLGAVPNNPQLMQQIMAMAQSLGGEKPPEPPKGELLPNIDMGMVQKLTGLAKQSGIDKREQALLRALESYLSTDRVRRLERAMRAAKMAKLATGFLSQQGLMSARR
jgi:hypothetical protein